MRIFFFSSRRRHTRSLCDWSSDVCSSDLVGIGIANRDDAAAGGVQRVPALNDLGERGSHRQLGVVGKADGHEIGRASCRERVWISVVGGSVKRKKTCTLSTGKCRQIKRMS